MEVITMKPLMTLMTIAATLSLLTPTARARGGGSDNVNAGVPWPARLMVPPGYYVSPGISYSSTVQNEPGQGTPGFELSLMKFNGFEKDQFSWGLSGDYTGDRSSGSHRVHVTPTLVAPGSLYRFGVDAGYVMERRHNETAHGLTGRLFMSVGVLSLYTRVSIIGNQESLEGGLLLKIPIRIK